MKNLNNLMVCFFIAFIANGQITNEGTPMSWVSGIEQSLALVTMPEFDLLKVLKEDEKNDKDLTKPWRFGHDFEVNLGLNNSGTWDELSNGDGIWRIHIVSHGAKTLNFIFNSYKLPEGATIYLYNESKSFKLGAYTSKMNNENESLGTWLADGDSIFIEYYEPANVRGEGKLNISNVVHGYRSISNYEAFRKGLNDSGDCNLDVNCSIGADFDPLKERLRKAVGMMVSGNSGFCTGSLINNTSHDKKPLFLTANHCGNGDNNWAFRFNWVSTNTVCATTDNSTSNGPSNYYQTTSGSRKLVRNGNSDVQLVEITGGLDPSWDLEWAGWDRTGNTPGYVVGIHHPSADLMKVCRDNSEVIKANNAGAKTWEITSKGAGWEMGVTEPGSSGSPLFDQDGHIIGQLFGGGAACSGTVDNDRFDYYGRFDVSWDAGGNGTTINSLSSWLDPTNTGEEIIDMVSQTLSVNDSFLESAITIFPNPSIGVLNILNKRNTILKYRMLNAVGQEVFNREISKRNSIIDISSFNNGIYFLNIVDKNTSAEITKKIILKH